MSTPLPLKEWKGKTEDVEQLTRQRKRRELFEKEFWRISRVHPDMPRADRRKLARSESKIKFRSKEATF